MEIDPISILWISAFGLLSFFAGNWFKTFNKKQDEHADKQKELSISSKEHEMDIKRIDSETRTLRQDNEKLDIKLKEETLGLQKDLRSMAGSVEKLLKTTVIHDIEIKNTKIDILTLKEENKIISEYIRGNIHEKK
jgi:hypothetical protein